jgi:hypothetical protein
MNPIDPANQYADSPERMLYMSILLLVAVAIFMLSSKRWGKKSEVERAAPSAQLPSGTGAEPEAVVARVGGTRRINPQVT